MNATHCGARVRHACLPALASARARVDSGAYGVGAMAAWRASRGVAIDEARAVTLTAKRAAATGPLPGPPI